MTGVQTCALPIFLAIKPHLDWPMEQSVGTHINVSHEAATPVGHEVIADVELVKMDGKKLTFNVEARDRVDVISKGTHERYIIIKEKFENKIKEKK